MKYSLIAALALILSVQTAHAYETGIEYQADPVYSAVIDGSEHPLQGLFELANEGDPRALFILGDLYSKQKGGAEKNLEVANLMFEHSAKLGAPESLIRLAALAKARGDAPAAYKWYEVAERRLTDGNTIKYVRDAQDKLALDGATAKDAREAARQWELARLAPLRLNTPTDPIKVRKPAPAAEGAAETEADVQVTPSAPQGQTVVDTTTNP